MDANHQVSLSSGSNCLHSSKPALESYKAYGFAIAIIIGIGGLTVAATGAAGYFGAISDLNQVQAIVMMAAGGGGGSLLFIAGIVGTVKNRPLIDKVRSDQPYQVNHRQVVRNTSTDSGCVFGKDFWRICGAEVVDTIPNTPEINWFENDPFFNEPFIKNYILIYMPEKIRIGSEEREPHFRTLIQTVGHPYCFPNRGGALNNIADQSPDGWVLTTTDGVLATFSAEVHRIRSGGGETL